MNGSPGDNNSHEDDFPFFADITLDLAEAHDIAVTPEPTRKAVVTGGKISRSLPRMPSIPDGSSSFEDAPTLSTPALPTTHSTSTHSTEEVTSSYTDRKTKFASIVGSRPGGKYHRNRGGSGTLPSARRMPRDVQWAVAFWLVVPLSLVLPLIVGPPVVRVVGTETWMATAPAPRLATLHTLLWGYGVSLVLSRVLYRTLGGGDGDDARHVASQVLLLSAPISVSVYVLLVVVIYFLLPHAWFFLLVPAWYLARDIFLFRSWKMTATTPGGRQAFFQALTCMTLDILSRSLRRSSFYRIVSLLLVVQLVVIAWWRWALLAALRSQSLVWILVAGLGGKWATGTVARLLSLIAAGGIHSWFAEQEALVQDQEEAPSFARVPNNLNNDDMDYENDDEDDDMIELAIVTDNGGYSKAYVDDPDDIPEAYRTVDASVYRSALPLDDGIDSDFEDEPDDDGAIYSSPQRSGSYPNHHHHHSQDSPHQTPPMVKRLLIQGMTMSFGSVARCGLLGGMAQFVWSQIRKVDTARATFGTLRGMSIGRSEEEENLSLWNRTMLKASVMARAFVRNNSDLAMSHVAAFSKSYQRAAQDVAILIDESGT